jgi:hypothetical protein
MRLRGNGREGRPVAVSESETRLPETRDRQGGVICAIGCTKRRCGGWTLRET